MKNSWSLNDGMAFEVRVYLNEKEVVLETREFGKTDVLGTWEFQQFLDSNGNSEVARYFGQVIHDEVLSAVKERTKNAN